MINFTTKDSIADAYYSTKLLGNISCARMINAGKYKIEECVKLTPRQHS